MALYVTVIPKSMIVWYNNPTQNSFYFDALVPDLGYAPLGNRSQNLAGTEDAYLTVEVFGGYNAITATTEPIDLRFKVNGNLLDILQVPRWISHITIMPVMRTVRIPLGILRIGPRPIGMAPNVGNNLLVVESIDPTDYFFIGPVVCQY